MTNKEKDRALLDEWEIQIADENCDSVSQLAECHYDVSRCLCVLEKEIEGSIERLRKEKQGAKGTRYSEKIGQITALRYIQKKLREVFGEVNCEKDDGEDE